MEHNIPMVTVDSSMIEAMGYDATHQIMRVKFPSGKVWDYGQVSPQLFADIQGAPSIGKAFNLLVRGQKPGKQVA
jgi:hypothetical protein